MKISSGTHIKLMGEVSSKNRMASSGHVELKSISQHVSDVLHKHDVQSTKQKEIEDRLLQQCVQMISDKVLLELGKLKTILDFQGGCQTVTKKNALQTAFSCRHAYASFLDCYSEKYLVRRVPTSKTKNYTKMKQLIMARVSEALPTDIRVTDLDCWQPKAFHDLDEQDQCCAVVCPCISLPLFWWRRNRIYVCMQFSCGSG